MTKEQVFEGLKEIISVLLPKTDISGVDYDTELVRGLGIDSLSMMLLSLATEEKFKLRFPDGEALAETVCDVCDNVLRQLA